MQTMTEQGSLLPLWRIAAGLERTAAAPQLLLAASVMMLLLSLWIVSRAARS